MAFTSPNFTKLIIFVDISVNKFLKFDKKSTTGRQNFIYAIK